MAKNNYVYPFRQNAKGTDIEEVFVQKGDALERYIFDEFVWPQVEKLGELAFVVDIGAGEGRYSQYFGTNAESVMAIEPDEYRCEKTRENMETMSAKVECIHGTVQDVQIGDGSADLVVNVHVLQHIHPDDATAILDFAERATRSGGLFVLVFTKKTKLDGDWNIVWTENSKSHYVEVNEEVFKLVSGSYLPSVLPVHKLRHDEVAKELEARNFSVETAQEYAPRFLGEKNKIKGKFFIWLYRKMSSRAFHKLVSNVGYPLLEDVVVVARKK